MRPFPALCLALAALALATVAAAQEPPDPIRTMRLSAEMAQQGRLRQDPWLLATAAKLRQEIAIEQVKRAPQGAAGDAIDYDPAETWLQEAEAMGAFDRRLKGFVADVRARSFKGRLGGPKVSTARLSAGRTHRYGEVFDPRRPAVVYVEGDGDSRLSLVVKDAAGGEACADSGPGDVKICSWTPSSAAAYDIEISNQGRVDNQYAVATN